MPEEDAKYSVVTVLGITGRVANFKQVHTEGSIGIKEVLVETFTEEQRATVKHICTDNPNPEAFAKLKGVLPNLEYLSLDPMHICFKFNRSQGKNRGPATHVLKRLMGKFVVQPAAGDEACNYSMSKGSLRQPSGYKALFALIQNQCMDWTEATDLISALRSNDELPPFKSRQEFLKHMAAFVTVYNEECSKNVFGKQDHPVHISLLNLCTVGPMNHLFNHLKFVASLTKD